MRTFEEICRTIEEALARLTFDQPPRSLFDPITYTLSLGGKRIRPALALMACDLFGGKNEDVLQPALGLEVFHNFTLLHDDLMDEADRVVESQCGDPIGRRDVDLRLSVGG